MRSVLLLVVLAGLGLGCNPPATEVIVRDPFAVSLLRVDGRERALILPAEPAPTPPVDKVERAIWGSHHVGSHRTVFFDAGPVANAPRVLARRFVGGGVSVATQASYSWGEILNDQGVLHLYPGDIEHTRMRIDPDACELVITMVHHYASWRRGGARALVDLELRTPLANVLQVRTVRVPVLGDQREVKVTYP